MYGLSSHVKRSLSNDLCRVIANFVCIKRMDRKPADVDIYDNGPRNYTVKRLTLGLKGLSVRKENDAAVPKNKGLAAATWEKSVPIGASRGLEIFGKENNRFGHEVPMIDDVKKKIENASESDRRDEKKAEKKEKKKTFKDSVKPHGTHLLVCSGRDEWDAPRLENVEGSFIQKMSKAIKKLNLPKAETIKVTAICETSHKELSAKNVTVTTGSVAAIAASVVHLAWTVASAKRARLRSRIINSVCNKTLDPVTDVISFPSRLRWRVRESQVDDFIRAVRFLHRPSRTNGSSEEDDDERNEPIRPFDWWSVDGCAPLCQGGALGGQIVLVCTHGSRDNRCGRAGPPLLRAIRNVLKDRGIGPEQVKVFASSHVGGHKFAGCIIVYPSADWYGYLTARNAKMIVDHLIAGKRMEKKFRGNKMHEAFGDTGACGACSDSRASTSSSKCSDTATVVAGGF
eukprot:g2487.t1